MMYVTNFVCYQFMFSFPTLNKVDVTKHTLCKNILRCPFDGMENQKILIECQKRVMIYMSIALSK